jgi:hypothetical protein
MPSVAEGLGLANRWVISMLGFPVSAYCWHRYTGDWAQTGMVLGSPLGFGYLIGFVAIWKMRFWTMRTKLSFRGMPINQGFIYASGMSLAFLALASAIPHTGILGKALIVLVDGLCIAIFGFVVDYSGVVSGRIRLDNPPFRLGRGPFAMVAYYAFICFGLMGLTYAIAAFLVLACAGQARSWQWNLMVETVVLAVTIVPPSAAYFYLEYLSKTARSAPRPRAAQPARFLKRSSGASSEHHPVRGS